MWIIPFLLCTLTEVDIETPLKTESLYTKKEYIFGVIIIDICVWLWGIIKLMEFPKWNTNAKKFDKK